MRPRIRSDRMTGCPRRNADKGARSGSRLDNAGRNGSNPHVAAVPIESTGLVAAIALGFVHIVLASHSASLQRGYRWTAGPRDEQLPPLRRMAGRLARASANFFETFPLFAAATLLVIATHTQSSWSTWGVYLYLAGRLAYLPLYAGGIFLIRSLAWNVAAGGIFAMCASALVGAASS